MNKSSQKWTAFIFQTSIGILLLAIFIYTTNFSDVAKYFSNVSFFPLSLAVLLYVLSIVLRVIRFKILLSPLQQISYKHAALTSFAGAFINYLIPLRAGEVGRIWLLKRYYPISLVSGTTVSVLDKVFDLFAVVLVICLSIPFVSIASNTSLLSVFQVGLFVLLLGCLYVVVFHGEKMFRILHRMTRLLPKSLRDACESILEKTVNGFSVLKMKKQIFLLILVLSLSALILDGIYLYILFVMLGFKIIFFLAILGHALLFFSYAIPAAPGYVGNIEVLSVLIFSHMLGVSQSIVVPTILLHHVLLTFMLSVLGGISIVLLHVQSFKYMVRLFH